MSSVVQKVIDASPPIAQGGLPAGIKRIQSEVQRVFQPIRAEWFSDVVAQRQWEPVSAYKFVFRSKRLEDAFNRQQLDVLDRAFNQGEKDSNVVINWAGIEPDAQLHMSQRGGDGQIVPNNVVYHVGDKKSINKYAALVAKSVGKMVSGWYQVMAKLGRPAKNPLPGQGKGDVSFLDGKGEITLSASNELGNFNGMLPKMTQPQQLINAAALNCQRRWDEISKGGNDPAKGKMGAPSKPMTTPNQQAASKGASQLASAVAPKGVWRNASQAQLNALSTRVQAVNKLMSDGYTQNGVSAGIMSVTAVVGGQVVDKGSSFAQIGKQLVEQEKGMQQLSGMSAEQLRAFLLEGWRDD